MRGRPTPAIGATEAKLQQRKLDADKRYREISDALKAHIARYSPAVQKLESIKTKDQNHAVDAAGLAVFGALNWEGC